MEPDPGRPSPPLRSENGVVMPSARRDNNLEGTQSIDPGKESPNRPAGHIRKTTRRVTPETKGNKKGKHSRLGTAAKTTDNCESIRVKVPGVEEDVIVSVSLDRLGIERCGNSDHSERSSNALSTSDLSERVRDEDWRPEMAERDWKGLPAPDKLQSDGNLGDSPSPPPQRPGSPKPLKSSF